MKHWSALANLVSQQMEAPATPTSPDQRIAGERLPILVSYQDGEDAGHLHGHTHRTVQEPQTQHD